MNVNLRDATTVIPRLRDAKLVRRDPWGEDGGHQRRPAVQRTVRPVGVTTWLIPALIMAGLGLLGIDRPGLWTDELATWGMSTSSWHDMFSVLRWVDAIIGPYYVVVHAWTGLVGSSDVAIRLPSVFAMAAAAALVGALGARLATPRVGLTAGIIFAILPNSSRFAQEARTYALTTCLAVLATYLLVSALQRPNAWRYLGYLVAVAALGCLHPIALLLLISHGWIVIAHYRRQTLPWCVCATLGALPALPLLWLGNQQKSQVAWIPPATMQSLTQFPQELVGVTALGLLFIGLSLFSLPLRRPAAPYTAWATLPLLALFAVGHVAPLFLPRYLLFTLPAWALLAASALGRTRLIWTIVVIVGVAGLAVAPHLEIRSSDGHGEDTRQLAALIAGQEQQGDGVVYGQADVGGQWVGRDTVAHYVPPARRPKDVLMVRPQRTNGQFAAQECADVATCVNNTKRIWVVRLGYQHDPLHGLDGAKEDVLRQRYDVAQVWHLNGFTLALTRLKSVSG